ncbi:MAG: hypothetical protein ACR2IP_04865 [Solirubrobacteraceae bacterium]
MVPAAHLLAEGPVRLRCGFFVTNLLMDLDGLRAGRLTTTRPLDAPTPWVEPRDIAAVAACVCSPTTGRAGVVG